MGRKNYPPMGEQWVLHIELHLYMDPSSKRSRGWNFVSSKEVLLVSWCYIIMLGDLSFS